MQHGRDGVTGTHQADGGARRVQGSGELGKGVASRVAARRRWKRDLGGTAAAQRELLPNAH